MSDLIGKDVDMVYATSDGTHGRGRVIGYCDAPTYIVELPDGTRTSWRADLTREAPAPLDLPTTPTVGWASRGDAAPQLGVWSTYEFSSRLEPDGVYRGFISPERDYPQDEVSAFTEATVVPTEALDALRSARRRDQGESGLPQGYEILCTAVREFLEAVDQAGAR